MAVFNPGPIPQAKDEMPDWTKVTHPISDIPADKSTALALATVGQGIEGAAGIIDVAAKDYVDKTVRNTVEPIREDYTNQLLATKDAMLGSGDKMDLTAGVGPTGPVPLPMALDTGLKKIDRIANMLQYGSGKLGVDETYYDMRLRTAVVDLRNRFPGYVDRIDAKVASITGMDPANETIKDVTRQIAQLQATHKTEYDKTVDLARKAISDGLGNTSATQNAYTMYNFLQNGGPAAQDAYLRWYYEENAKKAWLEDKAKARAATTGDREDRETQWHSDYRSELSSLISTNMNTLLTVTGMGDPNSLMGFIKDAAENPGKYNDVQLRQFAAYVGAQKAAAEGEADKIAGRQQKDGASYNSVVTSDKLNAAKTNIISNYYQSIQDALTKGNAGLAFQNANRAKALVDVKTDEVYSGPEGQNVLLLKVIEGAMGSQWAAQVSTDSINHKIDIGIRKLFELDMMKAKAGGKATEANPTGAQPTYRDMAGKLLNLQQSGRITERMRARYLDEGLNTMIKDITDPKAPDEAKSNALKFFFSPEGQGILQNFKDDYKKGNVFYPGRQTVWGKLTSDDVVKEVKRLSSSDPSLGTMYKNYVEKEAGAQLYGKDIKALNGFAGTDDVFIIYQDAEGGKTPYIKLEDKEGNDLKNIGMDTTSRRYYMHMQQTVDRVNQALAGMDRVHKGLGLGDASDNLLEFMMRSQAEFGERWKGLPEKLLNSIAAARGKGKLKDVIEQGITK